MEAFEQAEEDEGGEELPPHEMGRLLGHLIKTWARRISADEGRRRRGNGREGGRDVPDDSVPDDSDKSTRSRPRSRRRHVDDPPPANDQARAAPRGGSEGDEARQRCW